MSNLTKRSLVQKVSKNSWLRQEDIFNIVQHMLDGITEALATGRDVEIRNFGVFEVRLLQPRPGRNPNQPENEVTIPARASVKFKSGKIMTERVLERTQELVRKAPGKKVKS